MTGTESFLSGRAAELRRAFDQSFAEAIQVNTSETIDFISIRLAGDALAIRMTEIAGLFADVRITPCPSPVAELRGIAGFRGTLTPVYDLAALLGYPMSSARWIVLAKGRALALALDEFEGHFRVEPAAVASQQGSSAAQHVREIARQADQALPVIDIPSVVAAIKARAAAASSHKEH
jgi:purine-binding chemotaxis protein CheW